MTTQNLPAVHHSQTNQEFYMPFEDGTRAVLKYNVIGPGLYEFYHTETPAPKRHQGIAANVATAAMKWAKDNNAKIKVTCSYLNDTYLPNHPEWKECLMQ